MYPVEKLRISMQISYLLWFVDNRASNVLTHACNCGQSLLCTPKPPMFITLPWLILNSYNPDATLTISEIDMGRMNGIC